MLSVRPCARTRNRRQALCELQRSRVMQRLLNSWIYNPGLVEQYLNDLINLLGNLPEKWGHFPLFSTRINGYQLEIKSSERAILHFPGGSLPLQIIDNNRI